MATRDPLVLGPFSGGVNLFDDPSAIRDNELVEALNFDPGMDGSLKSRPPMQALGSPIRDTFTNARFLTWFYQQDPNPLFSGRTLSFMLYTYGGATWLYRTDTAENTQLLSFEANDAIQFNGVLWILAPAGSVGGSYSLIGGFTADANMPTGISIASYKSRLWIARGNTPPQPPSYGQEPVTRIYYSKVLGQANFWTSPGFLDVGSGDGQPVVKLVNYFDTLLVFKKSSTWSFNYGTDPATGIVSVLIPGVGLTDRASLVAFENFLYFMYDGQAYEFINSRATQINIKQPFVANEDPYSYVSFGATSVLDPLYTVSYYENRIIFNSTGNTYVFNLRTRSWTTWDAPTFQALSWITQPNPQGFGDNTGYGFGLQPWNAALRQNLCYNPTIANDLAGWNASVSATLARITTATGSASAIEMTATATGTVQCRFGTTITDSVPVSPGQYLTIQMKMRTPSGTRNGGCLVNYYASDGTTIVGTAAPNSVSINSAGWTSVAQTNLVVPAGAAMARIYWRISDAAAVGEKVWLDWCCIDVTNTPFVSLPIYFDGYGPSDTSFNYEWDPGVAGSTTSSQYPARFLQMLKINEGDLTISESFTCSATTKTYDFGKAGIFKTLFWWGADCSFSDTVNGFVTPIVYTPALSVTADSSVGDPAKPVQRFVRFLKKLRFREISFKVQFPVSGANTVVRLFTVSAYVAEKQTVSKEIT